MSMYEFSNSAVRVNYTVSNKFNVKVGIHQESVLSPFLFTMVLEALSRQFRSGLPWEMLYVDDFVIIAESGRALGKTFDIEKQHREQRPESQNRTEKDNELWHKSRSCICIWKISVR